MSRRILTVLALLAALTASLAPAAAPAALAAAPDLTLTSDTRYEVDPGNQLVHVTAVITAINHLKDTKTRLYYFDSAYLAVQPGTKNFKIAARTGSPKVRVASAKADRTLLRIDFGGRLPAGSSRTFTLTFDIPDPGGAPAREIRVGASLVTFGAWAFASEFDAGRQRHRRLPARLHDRGPDGRRRRADGRRSRSDGLHERPAHRAAQLLRLLRRGATERLRGVHPDRQRRRTAARRQRSCLARRSRHGPSGSAACSSAACRSCPSRSACRGSRSGRSSSPRPSAARPPATPGATTRRPVGSRSPTTPTRSSCSTRRLMPGSTAACWPIGGRTRASRRGTPCRRRPRSKSP